MFFRETDQSRNVKLVGRRQLQRPKPNLSRAVGKKTVLSQDKTDAETKTLHAETSNEKVRTKKHFMENKNHKNFS